LLSVERSCPRLNLGFYKPFDGLKDETLIFSVNEDVLHVPLPDNW